MTSRKQFIGVTSRALGRANVPAAPFRFNWRHSVHTDVMKGWSPDALAHAFIEYSRTTGVDVFETIRERLNPAIQDAVLKCSSGPVIMANDPLLDDLSTLTALETDREVRVWSQADSRENNIRFTEKAAAGIAVAKMALAESATVLLFSQNGCGRSVTLLPESVIYIIAKSRIRPRLTQGMAYVRQHKETMPSSVNFVSGPSATSDIELVRVIGIHGPVNVIHIVVHDM
jgi:L-lactate dehydrogenase complex protein LldG